MRFKPKVWTDHHTHRLFHLTQMMAFGFICIVIVYGIFFAFGQVQAGERVEQSQVGVSATVPAVSADPAVVEYPSAGGGGLVVMAPLPGTPEKKLPALKVPKIIITPPVGTPYEDVRINKSTLTSLPAFFTQNPRFEGITSIKNGIIFFEIHSAQIIRATTYTDDQGKWSWTSDEPVSPGVHTLFVTVQDQKVPGVAESGQFDFFIKQGALAKSVLSLPQHLTIVDLGNGGNLFDVLVKIPEQFKYLPPGDDMIATIKLINFGSAGHPVDVGVQYTIEDSGGKVVYQTSETLAVATQISIVKTFHTNQEFKEGIYKLTVRVPSKDIIATSADTFAIKGVPIIQLGEYGKIDFTLVFQSLLALLFLFSLVLYFEYNKVAVLSGIIKKVEEQDLRAYNN